MQHFSTWARWIATAILAAIGTITTDVVVDFIKRQPETDDAIHAGSPEETALLRLARAAPAQRRLVASAAQQERDARAAAAQRRLMAAAAQQDDWIRRWLKRQYEDALAAPLSPRLAALITQLETQDASA
jgi:hypothetical protein